jgi:hypothetical protein
VKLDHAYTMATTWRGTGPVGGIACAIRTSSGVAERLACGPDGVGIDIFRAWFAPMMDRLCCEILTLIH